MKDVNVRKLHCPTCGKVVLWNEDFPYRPFCSKRCQLIDFGEWAGEKHSIPGDSVTDSEQHDEGE